MATFPSPGGTPMLAAPYQPSWQNRFFSAMRRLPVPRLAIYVLITLGFVLLNSAVPWLEGGLPPGAFDPYQLSFQVWMLVVLVAGDYFIAAAGSALDRFRPALRVDDGTYAAIRAAYTQVPTRTGWILTAAALAFAPWSLSFGRPYQQGGLSAVALYLSAAFMFSLVFFFMYFLWRVVRKTADLYGQIQGLNVFHLDPLYALSGLSSRIGIFLIFAGVLSYLTNFVFTEAPNTAGFAFFATIDAVVAITAFLYPLHGIHGRLEAARERMAEANDLRLEAAYHEIHRRADARKVAGMSELHHEIQAILELRREIDAISTWPWGPGTLRTFVTALLVPIMLWISQQILARALEL